MENNENVNNLNSTNNFHRFKRKKAQYIALGGVILGVCVAISGIGQDFLGQFPKLRLAAIDTVENVAMMGVNMTLPSVEANNTKKEIATNGVLLPDISDDSNVSNTSSNSTSTETSTTSQTSSTSENPNTNTSSLLIRQNISDASEDLTVFKNKSGDIIKRTYGTCSGNNIISLSSGQVRNCTEIATETLKKETEIKPEFKITLNSEPQVLIMHTHTTESYEVSDRGYFDDTYFCRTLDPTQSVVAVGDKIAEKLAEKGIATIHDGTIHDDPSYSYSYSRSSVTVQDILAKYPSIKVVLDIHRDGIADSDGSRIAPVAVIDGKEAAQIMIICGCDDGTMDMPNYMQNFHFACALQNSMESRHAGLTRPVLFDYRYYNQDLTTGSLLIEVGSNGNTLAQALYSGELVGEGVADALLKLT